MTRFTVFAARIAIAAAIWLAAAASARAQPGVMPSQSAQAQSPAAKGTAVLRGHVYDAEGGRPLRGALVRIIAQDAHASRTASTDPQGAWEITELPAGHYIINASRNNYLALSYGQRRPGDVPTPLAIADGQTIEKLDIALPKGGVITGHVVDEYGDPVPNVVVMGFRTQYFQGQRRMNSSLGTSTTDDLGEYRIFGVVPGSYYIGAMYRTPPTAAIDEGGPAYAITFFPGTATAATAQRITIGFGESHDEVNIALVPVKTATVSGTAVKSTGEPMARGFVTITTTDALMQGAPGAQIQNDGTFVIHGVAPGEYRLQANSQDGGPNQRPEVAQGSVSVAGQDVAGVQLIVPVQATLSGRIVVDPAAAATTKPGTIIIVAITDAFPNSSSSTGRAADDFTFQMTTQPGSTALSVNGIPRSMAVRAIRLNGADVTDRGFDLKPGQNVTGIEIELTSQPTVVSGQVTDSRGGNATGATVLVFARDEAKWEGGSRYVKVTRSDQDGKFNLPGLPQGDYYAIALDSPNVNEISDPELLARFRDHATLLSLSDGETKVLDLRITSGL